MGGERFNGPEKSSSLHDILLRAGNQAGYTKAHINHDTARLMLKEKWMGKRDDFMVILTVQTVPEGQITYHVIPIVSFLAPTLNGEKANNLHR